MATTQFTCGASVATDAGFRNWVAALDTALTTVGLVHTADTGQLNPATATAAATVNTAAGYIIYRFDDTLQASKPLFLKVEYGSAGHTTAASSAPGMWLTLGTGSDGAGNITGVLMTRRQIGRAGTSTSVTGTTTASNGVASGGEGWVSLFPWLGNPSTGMGAQATPLPYFHIERTNGGNGVLVSYAPQFASVTYPALTTTNMSANSLPVVLTINYSTAAQTLGVPPVAFPYFIAGVALGASTSLASGSVGPVAPWIVLCPGLAPAQAVGILSYPGGDTPAGEFTVALGGVTRNYYPIPLSTGQCVFGVAFDPLNAVISRYIGAAIRWE